MTLDEFCDRHIEERDDLAVRRRGGNLTPEESARLTELNALLEALLPKPTPLPASVRAAMEQARRLLGE